MTFTPLQCIPSARSISLSLISIAIQMLTFKVTSHTGRGAGLQISEGVEGTGEVKGWMMKGPEGVLVFHREGWEILLTSP